MTDFPDAGYFSDPDRVNGEAALGQDLWLAATKQLPGGSPLSTLTIAGGLVTPTRGVHRIDTEGGAATDELLRVGTTNLPDGSLLCLSIVDGSRKVTVRDLAGGAGQINLAQDSFTLSTAFDRLWLQREGAGWREIERIYYAGGAAWRAYRGLSTAATYPAATNAEAVSSEAAAAERVITPPGLIYALNHDFRMIGGKPAVTSMLPADELLLRRNIGTELAPIWALRKVAYEDLVPRMFESGEYPINNTSNAKIAHGFGRMPSRIAGILRCKTNTHGYKVGDEVNVDSAYSEGKSRYVTVWCSITEVGYGCDGGGDEPLVLADRDGGGGFYALNNQWKLVLRAWR